MPKRVIVIYPRSAGLEPVIARLKQDGYEAELFTDPRVAVDVIWRQAPDFIAVGMHFDEFTGHGLMNLIRSGGRERPGSVPVLIIGETQINLRLAETIALHTGACGFLPLPCDPGQFLDLVRLNLDPEKAPAAVRDRWEQRHAIYVVDDEHMITRLIERSFKRVNVPVVQFHDPVPFLERLRETRPRAILLDYLLPGTTGSDVLLQIREIDPTVPVIIITARGSEEVAINMFRMGAADYLRKPFDVETLPDRVNRAVARQQSLVLTDALSKNLLELDRTNLQLHETNSQLAALNAELQTAQRELEELNQFKGTLLAACGHDLRAPLVSMITGSATLRQYFSDQIPSEAMDIVRSQHGAAMRLLTILNNLLDMEVIENNRLNLERQRVSLIEVLRDCVQDMSHLATSFEIKIDTHYPEEDLVLFLDREKISRVLYNLLANAIKYNRPRGKITLRASRTDGAARVEIADTGYGIPADKLEEIFEKFKSILRPDRRVNATTGLGLYLCRQFIESHGGTIWAESTEDEGSRFIFELPFAPARPALLAE